MLGLPGEYIQKLSVDNTLSAGGIRRVNFTDVDTEILGRPVHLAGLYVQLTVPWTSVAATMPGAMPGELLPAVIQDLRLRMGSHEYLRGTMDGKDILDCARQRVDRDFTPPSDIPDADDTGTVQVSVYIPICRPAAPGSMREDYMLPVLGLANCGQSEFTYVVGSSARAFAGVTFGTATAEAVYAHLVPLDDVRESIWHWERFTSDIQKLNIQGGRGGCEALLLRTVTAAGDPDVTDITEFILQVNGNPIGRAISGTDLTAANQLPRFGLAPLTYGSTAWNGLDWISNPTRYMRTKLARGRLNATWATRTGAERVLGMFTGDRAEDPAAVRAILGALKAPKSARVKGAFSKKRTSNTAVLDGKVYWAGMPGLPGRKAQAMGLKAGR